MKIVVTTLMIALAAGAAMAQDPTAQAADEARVAEEAARKLAETVRAYGESSKGFDVSGKILTELAAAKHFGQQRNSPFSAEEVNESVQTLADGNRIVRSSTGKFYRNSEGRIRRDRSNGIGGVLGTTYSYGQGISIVSPSVNQTVLLDETLKTARVVELAQRQNLAVIADSARAVEQRTKELSNLAAQLKPSVRAVAPVAGQGVFAGNGQVYTVNSGQLSLSSKYETRTEELGTRDFEGVLAEGTRRTTIIPEGAIGNERPIEVVYERWYSKELGMVVYSKNTDPRSGEQTYKLTNIIKGEPDPSLFSIPTEYRKIPASSPVRTTAGTKPTRTTPTAKAVNVSSPPKAVNQ